MPERLPSSHFVSFFATCLKMQTLLGDGKTSPAIFLSSPGPSSQFVGNVKSE